MIDLTGASLVAYLLRIIRDIVAKNPRYRKALGEVTFQTATARTPANLITFGDVQVIVKSVSSSGNRLSPDYFMCTQHGRTILAQVEDKDGLFVEFVREVDPGNTLLDPGVYYMNVDSVDEATRDVGLTLQKFKWREGYIPPAQGSFIYFREGLDGTVMVPSDTSNIGAQINFAAFQAYLILYTPIQTIAITDTQTGVVLTPTVDYWITRNMGKVICQSTVGGEEVISIPTNATGLSFQDQTGYVLRQRVDYTYYMGQRTPAQPAFILLSSSTPIGSTITAVGMYQEDPSPQYATVNPENFLNLVLQPNETLTPNQVSVQSAITDPTVIETPSTATPANALLLSPLLGPGQWARWEVRINAEMLDSSSGAMVTQLHKNGRKMEMNKDLVPGLWLAIGDLVVKDDQVAIIVSPTWTETYEVFGSKENLSFTLEVKSNDLTTSSEISELIKHRLLVQARTNMEADGITIFEVGRDQQGEQRDLSGTAPSYSYMLNVSAAADWKTFIPLVTRLISFEVNSAPYIVGYPGKLVYSPRTQAMGRFQFTPWTA
jgi:hypothetical protein